MKQHQKRNSSVMIMFVFAVLFVGLSFVNNFGKSEMVYADAPADERNIANEINGLFRKITAQALPVVVQLEVIENRDQYADSGMPWEYFFQNPDEALPDFKTAALGSGIIVRRQNDDYFIITNNHVVGEAQEILIVMFNGDQYPAVLVGKDERKDIALIKFTSPEKQHAVAVLGDSDLLYVGDWVLAIGSPFGYQSSVSAGIVSALGRQNGPDGNINDFIQTDAAINQGNSGGALVNLKGEVVGINTWITSSNGGSMGLGFSIPINNVKRTIDDIIAHGEPRYGWLGTSVSLLTPEVKDSMGLAGKNGVFIHHIFIGSPSEKSGMLPGDFITAINGIPINDPQRLTYVIGDTLPGETLQFNIIRFSEELNIDVIIEERGDEQSIRDLNKLVWPGLQVRPLADDALDNGLLVESVYPKSVFQTLGLAPGDIITRINGEQIETVADFYRVLNNYESEGLVVEYRRNNAELVTPKVFKPDFSTR